MEKSSNVCLWKNFAGAIDMFGAIIELCPDHTWKEDDRFFYMSYHTMIFLDFYLSRPVKEFNPLLTYTLVDPGKLPSGAIDDVIPNERYSRQDMLRYLSAARAKCRKLILGPSPEKMNRKWIDDSEVDLHGLCPALVKDYTVLEILFYNFRHLQHHVGQLNYILRQKTDRAADWISQAD